MEGIISAFHPQEISSEHFQFTAMQASKTCKPKEEVSLPPKIIITHHKREIPLNETLAPIPTSHYERISLKLVE